MTEATTAEVIFDGDADAVVRARRLVRSTVSDQGDLADDAELIISELVTNALLHGEPPVRVRVHAGEVVRIEVRDTGRSAPIVLPRNTDAMTGRGLALVAALASSWGVDGDPTGGKVVWAELSPEPRRQHAEPGDVDIDALLAAWADEGPDQILYTVRLGEVSTELLRSAKAHHDNVVRELTLMREGALHGKALPAETAALVQSVTADFADARAEMKRLAADSTAAGRELTDLVLHLPASAAEAAERYLAALDEADRYARSAHLLTLAPPPVHRLFRQWYVRSLVEQLRALERGATPPPVKPFQVVLTEALYRVEGQGASGVAESLEPPSPTGRPKGEARGRPTQTAAEAARARGWRAHLLPAVTLLVGFAITAGITVFAHLSVQRTEAHLLKLQTELTANAIQVAPVDIQRRLGPRVTAAASGNSSQFAQMIDSSVHPPGPFDTAELWRVGAGTPQLVATAGGAPAASPAQIQQIVVAARGANGFTVTWMHSASAQRFAYAQAATGPAGTFVAYAEQPLPGNRMTKVPKGSPGANLDYEIFLGPARPQNLVIATATAPFHGPTATATLPFANQKLTLVAAARGPLAGTFSTSVPWWVAAAGVLLTLAAAAVAETLVRRNLRAESLAQENLRMYQEQRSVAETLQRSLLPDKLPKLAAVETAARYLPGTAGIEVGGDWYDVLEVGGRVFFTVGDVSGRGLSAATLMGQLRYLIDAFALEGDQPDALLARLSRLVEVADDRFATVLCGLLDPATGQVMMANAGHLPPALADEGGCRLLDQVSDPPIGVGTDFSLMTVQMRPGALLVLVTDGLVERRGESLVDGLRRLCETVGTGGDPNEVVDRVVAALVPAQEVDDDMALLALRWTGPPTT